MSLAFYGDGVLWMTPERRLAIPYDNPWDSTFTVEPENPDKAVCAVCLKRRDEHIGLPKALVEPVWHQFRALDNTPQP